jgi:hypothetical protein
MSRGTVEDVFLALQALLETIAGAIASWRQQNGISSSALWEVMRRALLAKEYTVYIQQPPSIAQDAVESLSRFFE